MSLWKAGAFAASHRAGRVTVRAMPKVPALILTPAARDEAIARLAEHYAQNHLETAEYERRVERAENATTTAELDDALAGLPPLEEQALVPRERAGQLTSTVRALLSTATHRGKWKVPSRVVVNATLGAVELDLVDADIAGEVEIEVKALLGSVRIVVPEDLAVSVSGRAVLGSFDHLSQDAARGRDRRSVRITGSCLLGSVEVVVKRAPKGLLSTVKGLLGGGGN